MTSILGGNRSVESIWSSSPTANGHTFAFASDRSPGYIDEMDPSAGTSGFERSIVLKTGLASSDVLAGARGSATTTGGFAVDPGLPTLLTTGIKLAMPTLTGATSVGRQANLRVPFKIRDRGRLPAVLEASVRWDPVDVVSIPVGADLWRVDPAPAVQSADRARSRQRRADRRGRGARGPDHRETRADDGRQPARPAGPLPAQRDAARQGRGRVRRPDAETPPDGGRPGDGRHRRSDPRRTLGHAHGRRPRLAADPDRQPGHERVGPRSRPEPAATRPPAARGRGAARRPLGCARRRGRADHPGRGEHEDRPGSAALARPPRRPWASMCRRSPATTC